MLTIWGRLNSHNVKKVVWFAEELGLAYQRHDVGGTFGMDAAYLARNPAALIPTVEIDGITLWESNAILRYLAAAHGGERWWPSDPVTRAMADRWMDWQADFAEMQRPMFLGFVRTPEDQRNHEEIQKSIAAASKRMEILDRFLAKSGWLSGSQFGIGDIPMGVYAHTYFALPFERPALPHARAWYAALQQRPGYAENVMIPLT